MFWGPDGLEVWAPGARLNSRSRRCCWIATDVEHSPREPAKTFDKFDGRNSSTLAFLSHEAGYPEPFAVWGQDRLNAQSGVKTDCDGSGYLRLARVRAPIGCDGNCARKGEDELGPQDLADSLVPAARSMSRRMAASYSSAQIGSLRRN